MRQERRKALEVAWRVLAEAGEWWCGAERVAVTREPPTARECTSCRERKAAPVRGAVVEARLSSTALPLAGTAGWRSDPGMYEFRAR